MPEPSKPTLVASQPAGSTTADSAHATAESSQEPTAPVPGFPMPDPAALKDLKNPWAFNKVAGDAWEYWVDAAQRSVLFWNTLRKRGNIFNEHREKGKPPVLSFPYETLIDGRTLEQPVNYALLRIIPPENAPTDPAKRPFVIVDPRAGHGPGIGGFKADSQVGVAMRANHPVYFVAFLPDPQPGQTIVDVGRAEAGFLEEIIRRHPDADKPCLIGNCQAGWAVAMLAAIKPDLTGPIILNGSPMSYWAGVEGKNPMRYSGGLLGGKWLANMASDLGNGIFDGAYLVQNFENLNPANTFWSKQYNLYAKIDTEEKRFLEFEKWWGGLFFMTAEEMDFIVSNLFIGNKLAHGGIQLPDGRIVDLKNIKAPIVVFASHGDNITPPQQALNWIVDVYQSDDEIVRQGQTIVYLLHQDIGHLGIFVSGAVAKKQHSELVNTLGAIDRLPPGLYEMVIEKKNPFVKRADLLPGDFTVRFEYRTLDDIRALDDGVRDEDYFTSVAGISDINDQLYQTVLSPWIKLMTSAPSAQFLRETNPVRLQRTSISDLNPWLAFLQPLADIVKENRQPVAEGNYFLSLERDMAQNIVERLNAYRDFRDNINRNLFKALYGPLGFGAFFPSQPLRAAQRDEENKAQWQVQTEEAMRNMDKGGFPEAVLRLLLAAMDEDGMIDQRSHRIASAIWKQDERLKHFTPVERKQMIREQSYMLRLDKDRALETLAVLLPEPQERRDALRLVARIMMVNADEIDPEGPLAKRIAKILAVDPKQISQSAA